MGVTQDPTKEQAVRIAIAVVTILIALLSIAAGAAKVALVPDEVAFLSQFGLATVHTVSFGVVQVLGGILLVIPSTRLYGSLIAAAAFALSAALLFAAGDLTLASVSLLPVILACLLAYQTLSARPAADISEENS